LIDSLVPDGAERQMALTVTNLPKEYEVRCFALGGGPFAAYLRDREIDLEIARRRWKYDPLPLLRLWGAVIRWRPDLVHSWGYLTTLAGFPIYRALGIPFIDATIRTGDVELVRSSRSTAGMDRAAIVVANSQSGLASAHIPPERGRVIRNGFDFSRVAAAPSQRKDERFTVVMAARMHPAKDYACFIAAARALAADLGPGTVRFLALGEGPDRHRLESEAKDLIETGVLEFGFAPDVIPRLLACDCGVLMTSPIRVEGCSNTILEYMACGLPVVCSRGGGTDELVVHEDTGLLVAPGDYQGLATQLRWVYQHRETARTMGVRAAEMVRREYSVETMIRATEQVYAEALGAKRT
jgi:glycosyltransferase involved in cell wall biosynthesis